LILAASRAFLFVSRPAGCWRAGRRRKSGDELAQIEEDVGAGRNTAASEFIETLLRGLERGQARDIPAADRFIRQQAQGG
jgi:hypothetical protein